MAEIINTVDSFTVKVVMLKGEKGEKGEDGSSGYDDTEIRTMISDEATTRAQEDASLESQIENIGMNVYYVGDVIITSSNTAPNRTGTWSLIQKGLAENYISNVFSAGSTGNTGSISAYICGSGITLTGDLKITNIPSGSVIGSIDLNSLGLSDLSISGVVMAMAMNMYSPFQTCSFEIDNTGDIKIKGYSTSGTSTDWMFTVSFDVASTHMVDSACDKFYWKRTA